VRKLKPNEIDLLGLDSLNFDLLRGMFRSDPDYQEVRNKMVNTDITSANLKSQWATVKIFIAKNENTIRAMLERLKASQEKFNEMRKNKEETDFNERWKPMFDVMDDKEKTLLYTIGNLLLCNDMQNILLDKFQEQLDKGYDEGWKNKVTDEMRNEIKDAMARLDPYRKAAGITFEQMVADSEKKEKDYKDRLRQAKMTEGERREEFEEEVVMNAINKLRESTGEPPRTTDITNATPLMTKNVIDALKRIAQKNKARIIQSGKEKRYELVISNNEQISDEDSISDKKSDI
jgi:hypothetical protein